jgi:hypothetical protein
MNSTVRRYPWLATDAQGDVAFEADVADLRLGLTTEPDATIVFAEMTTSNLTDHELRTLERLEELVCARYGRDGDVLHRGHRLLLQEAGYGTVGMWSSMQAVLHSAGTSFQTVEVNTRLDLLFRDLISYPEDAPSSTWAQLYGYSTAAAASRAFRARFELPLGYVRRMGEVGRWIETAQREPRSAAGVARLHGAQGRLRAFRARARQASLGPRAQQAVNGLGLQTASTGRQLRPRYPAVTKYEAVLLDWVARS